MNKNKQKVINFFASPSSGKSTNTALLFGTLKNMGVNCEIALEYAKELVWAERKVELIDQLCVLGGQLQKQRIVENKVDFVITDSPILLSSVYNQKYDKEIFEKLCLEAFNQFDNINILLRRTKKYNPAGRLQTEEESDKLAGVIKDLLNRNNVNYTEFDGDKDCIDNIINYLIANGDLSLGEKYRDDNQ